MEFIVLHQNGLRATLVIKKQYISSQDRFENCLGIISGVLDVSILEPLLFQIYGNELFKVSNLLIEVIFADDKNLFLPH